MTNGLYTATQGMIYETMRMDVIANNLANGSTPGYKQDRIGINTSFETYYDHAMRTSLVADPPVNVTERPTIIYTRQETDFTQGALEHTQNPLDIALDGVGFFAVQHPDGTVRYTRDGHFRLNANQQLVTPHGWPVLGQSGPIQLGEGRTEIDSRGQVFSNGVLVDTLRVEDVPQLDQLAREGGNLFAAPAGGTGALAPANTEVRQGYLEQSNVDIVREMVRMIEALRNYEGYQKTIQSIDTTVSQANEVGRA